MPRIKNTTSASTDHDLISDEGAAFISERAAKLEALVTDYPETRFDIAIERFMEAVTRKALPVIIAIGGALALVVIGHQAALSLGLIR